MLFDRPSLVTDSIIQNMISEKPVHIYRVMNPNKYNNKLCLICITVILIFLLYKNYLKNQQLKRQRIQAKLKELQKQQQLQLKNMQQNEPKQQLQDYPFGKHAPINDSNYIPDVPEPYVEHFSQNTKNNSDIHPLDKPDESIINNSHNKENNYDNNFDNNYDNNFENNYENNYDTNNMFNSKIEKINNTSNDRLLDNIHNVPNYKVKETSLPNINFKNISNDSNTDPMDLIRPEQNEMPKELSLDELQKLRSLQDNDIKKIFNNNNSVDIRKRTEYTNKKDHRNENNRNNNRNDNYRNENNLRDIQQEVKSEQKLHEDNLGSSTLGADDALSFSFL